MIERGLDVKDLINSPLFYAPLWTNYSLFAEEQEPVLCPANCDIDDLEFKQPDAIFAHLNEESGILNCFGSVFNRCFQDNNDTNSNDLDMLNKKAVYLYMREMTGLTTKQIVSQLNKMKKKYNSFRRDWDEGKI